VNAALAQGSRLAGTHDCAGPLCDFNLRQQEFFITKQGAAATAAEPSTYLAGAWSSSPPCPAHAHLRSVPTAKACWEPHPWFRSGMLALCRAGERSDLDTLRHMSDMCTLGEQQHDQEVLYHVTVLSRPRRSRALRTVSASTSLISQPAWHVGTSSQPRSGGYHEPTSLASRSRPASGRTPDRCTPQAALCLGSHDSQYGTLIGGTYPGGLAGAW
jgi:hypothetical protein